MKEGTKGEGGVTRAEVPVGGHVRLSSAGGSQQHELKITTGLWGPDAAT